MSGCLIRSNGSASTRSDVQRLDLPAVRLDVAQLDVLVAANAVRQPRGLDRALVGVAREPAQRPLDQRAVLAGQRPLDAADLGAAEWIEGGAAQPLHAPQGPEGAVEPGAELQLAREPERAGHRRRGTGAYLSPAPDSPAPPPA